MPEIMKEVIYEDVAKISLLKLDIFIFVSKFTDKFPTDV